MLGRADCQGGVSKKMQRSQAAISKGARAGVTRYLQLYTVLAQELANGRFKPNQPLPSEPALVARYRVSRTTVRRALARLEREGKIVRKRGSGTFARGARQAALRCPCCGQLMPGGRRRG
jgi:DNA-binding GntR family transcriptional regulator